MFFILLSPMLLYWVGLSYLENNPVPSKIELSSEQEKEIWSKEQEHGSPRVKSITPYSYIASIYCHVKNGLNAAACMTRYPGLRLSALAVRNQVFEQVQGQGKAVWHLSWSAYTIWVTNNWNIHQIIRTYHEAYST
jgi:hypothetical protein